jgi:hypothetical protein
MIHQAEIMNDDRNVSGRQAEHLPAFEHAAPPMWLGKTL